MSHNYKLYFFTSNSIAGCERAEREFYNVCKRFKLEHEAILLEFGAWKFPKYGADGVPCLVLTDNDKPIQKAIGVFSETAFESTLHEWGL